MLNLDKEIQKRRNILIEHFTDTSTCQWWYNKCNCRFLKTRNTCKTWCKIFWVRDGPKRTKPFSQGFISDYFDQINIFRAGPGPVCTHLYFEMTHITYLGIRLPWSMPGQYQLFEQLELQRRCHTPTRFSFKISHGLLQQSTTKLEKATKDTITNSLIINISKYLPLLQRVPQSLQYFGCEEIGYDLLHWLHISSK